MPTSCLPKSATPSCVMSNIISVAYETQLTPDVEKKNPLRHELHTGARKGEEMNCSVR